MAYATVPGRRMAYDDDGTIVGSRRQDGTSSLDEKSAAEKALGNDEDPDKNAWGQGGQGKPASWSVLIFPELRDFDGLYAQAEAANQLTVVETSADTTNSWDGTWTQRSANIDDSDIAHDAYRSNITSFSVSSIRAIRIGHIGLGDAQYINRLHVYGGIASGETPDRLLFIDVGTGLEFTVSQDWGDIPRGTTHDKTIRVKNNSSSLTANTITLSFEDLYLGSSSWYTVKETGGSFATTLSITSIASGVTYPTGTDVITIRKATPDAETLGLHAARCKAATTSWT